MSLKLSSCVLLNLPQFISGELEMPNEVITGLHENIILVNNFNCNN